MANGINFLAGAVANSVSSPAGTATKRSGVEHEPAPHTRNETSSTERVELLNKVQAQWDKTRVDETKESVGYILELSENLSLAKDTTIHFERNDENGKMYMHVCDKQTGEVLYRIPRDFLQDLSQEKLNLQLDVRI